MGRINRVQRSIQGQFVGRRNEQDEFIQLYREFLANWNTPDPTTFKQVLLIYAEGGMGKSTLANRLAEIAREATWRKPAKTFVVDWELYDIHSSIDMMDLLASVIEREFPKTFRRYEDKRKQQDEVKRKVNDAREKYGPLVSSSAEMLKAIAPIGEVGKIAVEEFVHSAASELAKAEDHFSKLLRQTLNPEEFKLYRRPQLELSKAFVSGLVEAASTHPILFLFDTYEVVERFDSWLREGLIKNTINESAGVMFIISGREDHVVAYRSTLPEEFVYDRLLRGFSPLDIADYLSIRLRRWSSLSDSARQTLVDQVTRITKGVPFAVDVLATAINSDENIEQAFGDLEDLHLDIRQVAEATARRFLKYCLDVSDDSEEEKTRKRRDRDYIYTYALLRSYEDLSVQDRIVDVIWKKSNGYDSVLPDVGAVQDYLKQQYSFMFSTSGVMHPIVRQFVRKALRDGSLPRGNLSKLNAVAITYFELKLSELKGDYQTKLRSIAWQENTLNLLNHLFWQGRYEEGFRLLVNVVVASSLYAYFDFRDRVIGLLRNDHEVRSHIPIEYDAVLQSLLSMSELVGNQSGNTTPALLQFQRILFSWLDQEISLLNDLSQVEDLARAGRLEEALTLLRDTDRRCADGEFSEERAKAFMLLGNKFAGRDKAKIVEELMTRAVALDQNNALAYVGLGDFYLGQHQLEKAVKYFHQAYELNDTSFTRRKYLRALQLSQLSNTTQLKSSNLRAIHSTSWKLVNRGVLQSRDGQLEAASETFRAAVEADPSNLYARIRYSNALRHLGQLEESLVLTDGVISQLRGFRADRTTVIKSLLTAAYDAQAATLLLRGDLRGALTSYQNATDLSGNYVNALNGTGLVYLRMGNYTAAQRRFTKALNTKNDAYWIYNYMGITSLLQSHSSKQWFESAHDNVVRKLESSLAYKYHAKYHLAVSLYGLGKIEQSYSAFLSAIHICSAKGMILEVYSILSLFPSLDPVIAALFIDMMENNRND